MSFCSIPSTLFPVFLNAGCYHCCGWYIIVDFICIFIVITMRTVFLMCYWPSYCLCDLYVHFFPILFYGVVRWFVAVVLEFCEFSSHHWYKSFVRHLVCKYFLSFLGKLFCLALSKCRSFIRFFSHMLIFIFRISYQWSWISEYSAEVSWTTSHVSLDTY